MPALALARVVEHAILCLLLLWLGLLSLSGLWDSVLFLATHYLCGLMVTRAILEERIFRVVFDFFLWDVFVLFGSAMH